MTNKKTPVKPTNQWLSGACASEDSQHADFTIPRVSDGNKWATDGNRVHILFGHTPTPNDGVGPSIQPQIDRIADDGIAVVNRQYLLDALFGMEGPFVALVIGHKREGSKQPPVAIADWHDHLALIGPMDVAEWGNTAPLPVPIANVLKKYSADAKTGAAWLEFMDAG